MAYEPAAQQVGRPNKTTLQAGLQTAKKNHSDLFKIILDCLIWPSDTPDTLGRGRLKNSMSQLSGCAGTITRVRMVFQHDFLSGACAAHVEIDGNLLKGVYCVKNSNSFLVVICDCRLLDDGVYGAHLQRVQSFEFC